MLRGRNSLLSLGLIALASLPAQAKEPGKRLEPKILSDTFACSAVTDDRERLACFDRSVTTLKDAYRRDDLLVADRATIRKAKKSLFGLTLPSFDLFGGGDGKQASDSEDNRIDAVIQSARFESDGSMTLVLEGAGTWRQADDYMLGALPAVGSSATVKRAALGSYRISFGHFGFKARRVN